MSLALPKVSGIRVADAVRRRIDAGDPVVGEDPHALGARPRASRRDALTVATTRPLRGSIRATVSSGSIAQTAPSPTTICARPTLEPVAAAGRRWAAWPVCVIVSVAGIDARHADHRVGACRCGRALPTHTAPAPAATAAGIEFAVKCPVIAFVRGSMRVTFASSVSSAQTAPSPTARLLGVTGELDERAVAGARRVERDDAAARRAPAAPSRRRPRSDSAAAATAASTTRPAPAATRPRARRRGARAPGASAARAAAISSPQRRVAILLVLRQRPPQHGVERRTGSGGGSSCRCAHSVSASRLAPERRRARQALVEHARERVLVAAAVDRLAADLLGREVVERADEPRCRSCRRRAAC